VVVDTDGAAMTDVGAGVKCITRTFARDLRKRLWQKHLGMLVDQKTTGVQKQGNPNGIDIQRPLEESTIRAIQKLAAGNRQTYNEVFVHTPRDSFGTLTEGRVAGYTYKTKDRNGAVHDTQSFAVTPPLQPTYMDQHGKHKVGEALSKLASGVKGFWVAMPLDWGNQEGATPRPPLNAPSMIAETNTKDAAASGLPA